MFSIRKKNTIPTKAEALPGRTEAIPTADRHFVKDVPLKPPFPQNMERIAFGMGCFWGAERIFWQQDGVYTTAVGYGAGHTPNASYEEVCSGMTGHNEIVLVVYDPVKVSTNILLQLFWQSHDPTQFMRQGGDMGTQYRSGIYFSTEEQKDAALLSRTLYQQALEVQGKGQIVTEIIEMPEFYYAEDYHQQYLAKKPNGYCGLGGTGISCPDLS